MEVINSKSFSNELTLCGELGGKSEMARRRYVWGSEIDEAVITAAD